MRKILGSTPLLSAEDYQKGKKKRFMIVNVWRSIRDEPVEVYPLGFCDARSTKPEAGMFFRITSLTSVLG